MPFVACALQEQPNGKPMELTIDASPGYLDRPHVAVTMRAMSPMTKVRSCWLQRPGPPEQSADGPISRLASTHRDSLLPGPLTCCVRSPWVDPLGLHHTPTVCMCRSLSCCVTPWTALSR